MTMDQKIFDVIQDSGLNFHMKLSVFHYIFLERPWNYLNVSHVFNFEVEKIDQNELKLDIQNLFYTNLSTQNPMS